MSKKILEKLKNIWYHKLKQAGFEDIEQDETRLKSWSYYKDTADPKKEIYWTVKAEYFRLASQFLHEHNFESQRERLIWHYHCEGISVRKMAIKFNRENLKKSNIGKIIKKLKYIMVKKCCKNQN